MRIGWAPFAAVVALCVSGCGSGDQSPSTGEIDVIVQDQAKDAVRAKLRDPDSAEFTGVRISRKSGNPIACGEVNSKNGFGGRTGAQRFVSGGGGVAFLEEEMQPGSMDEIWARFC